MLTTRHSLLLRVWFIIILHFVDLLRYTQMDAARLSACQHLSTETTATDSSKSRAITLWDI